MRIDTLREKFAEFLQEQGLDNMIVLDTSLTVKQENTLRYERIDKYKVLLLQGKELDGLLGECSKLGLSVWFGADRLCIGYEHRKNMRLSAYNNLSVLPAAAPAQNLADRIHDEHRAGYTPVLPPITASADTYTG